MRKWCKEAARLTIGYWLLLGLLALLWYVYRLPGTLFADLVWNSLWPVLGWVAWRLWHTKQRLKQTNLIPRTLVETELTRRLAQAKRDHRHQLLQLQARQRQELDYVDRFAHEIKNALMALEGLTAQPTVASALLKPVLYQANRNLDLLLNAERLQFLTNDFAFEWLDLTALCQTVVQSLAPLMIAQQLRPQFAIGNIKVLSDRKWLTFIVTQLVTNAVKYSPPGRVVTFAWQASTLQIIDQGPGVAPSDLPRVFEAGFTGQNGHQTTRATGMGLYLAQQAATKINLTLALVNRPSHGIRAEVHFPAAHVKLTKL